MSAITVADTPSLEERLVQHWRAVLPQVKVEHEPYDHLYFEDFFPSDFYAEMLKSFPAPEKYQAFNRDRYARADGESARDIIVLQDSGIAHLDEPLRSFWRAIGEAASSDVLKRHVFNILKRDVALRLGIKEEDAADADAFVSVLLVRDTEGYKIRPHPDGFPRLVTLMLYLPEDNGREDLGTSIYVEQPFYKRLVGDKFREVKRFPFRPNSAAAFAVNDLPQRRSLHGREPIESVPDARNVIIVTWYSELPKGEKSKDRRPQSVHKRLG